MAIQADQAATLTIEPITATIGAEITGLDASRPLDAATAAELEAAIATYGVVFLPAHPGDLQAHRHLADALGPINMPHPQLPHTLAAQGHPEIAIIGTEVGNAKYANVWHSDVTWMATPSKYSILHFQHGPAAGGDTMWCGQIAAFEALSPALQAFLEGLTAHHEIGGRADAWADHPVVIRHPRTGRKSLFVNKLFTTRINELQEHESRDLLELLVRWATIPEHTVRKHWQPGQFGIWDNHFVQHYAVNDYGDADRRIHRIEIKGEAPVAARP